MHLLALFGDTFDAVMLGAVVAGGFTFLQQYLTARWERQRRKDEAEERRRDEQRSAFVRNCSSALYHLARLRLAAEVWGAALSKSGELTTPPPDVRDALAETERDLALLLPGRVGPAYDETLELWVKQLPQAGQSPDHLSNHAFRAAEVVRRLLHRDRVDRSTPLATPPAGPTAP